MISLAVCKKSIIQAQPLRASSGIFLKNDVPFHRDNGNGLTDSKIEYSHELLRRIEDNFADDQKEMSVSEHKRSKARRRNQNSKCEKNQNDEDAGVGKLKSKLKPKVDEEKISLYKTKIPDCFDIDPIAEDNNSIYRCIAKQLFKDSNGHHSIRQKCVAYLRKNPNLYKGRDEPLDTYLERMNKIDSQSDATILKCLCYSYRINIYVLEYHSKRIRAIVQNSCFSEEVFVYETSENCFQLLIKNSELPSCIKLVGATSMPKSKVSMSTNELGSNENSLEGFFTVQQRKRNRNKDRKRLQRKLGLLCVEQGVQEYHERGGQSKTNKNQRKHNIDSKQDVSRPAQGRVIDQQSLVASTSKVHDICQDTSQSPSDTNKGNSSSLSTKKLVIRTWSDSESDQEQTQSNSLDGKELKKSVDTCNSFDSNVGRGNTPEPLYANVSDEYRNRCRFNNQVGASNFFKEDLGVNMRSADEFGRRGNRFRPNYRGKYSRHKHYHRYNQDMHSGPSFETNEPMYLCDNPLCVHAIGNQPRIPAFAPVDPYFPLSDNLIIENCYYDEDNNVAYSIPSVYRFDTHNEDISNLVMRPDVVTYPPRYIIMEPLCDRLASYRPPESDGPLPLPDTSPVPKVSDLEPRFYNNEITREEPNPCISLQEHLASVTD